MLGPLIDVLSVALGTRWRIAGVLGGAVSAILIGLADGGAGWIIAGAATIAFAGAVLLRSTRDD